jgi:fluoride exporter
MYLLMLATTGGALGAGARYLVNVGCLAAFGPAFPWATLTVNVLGSLAMGVLAEVIGNRYGGAPELRTFLMTGILGGFTTFSAFSLDIANLAGRDALGLAALYTIGSVVLSLLALYAGLALGRGFLS